MLPLLFSWQEFAWQCAWLCFQVPTVYVNMIEYFDSVKDEQEREAMRAGAAALRLMA